jgi:Fe-S cluster biogenesis protein NfuA
MHDPADRRPSRPRSAWPFPIANQPPESEERLIERSRVEAVLNRIRPFLQADGADIELVDVRTDCVSVRLIGLGQCKIAALSMHMGLSEVLREQIPGFAELRLV